MLGLEQLLIMFFSGSEGLLVLLPIAGLFGVVFINLTVSIWGAIKRHEFEFDKLLHFAGPLGFYLILLFSLEIMVVSSRDYNVIYTLFRGAEILTWTCIMLYYCKQIFGKLKNLGMPAAEIEEVVIDKIEDAIKSSDPTEV
jgi:hypothetical protein